MKNQLNSLKEEAIESIANIETERELAHAG